MYRRNANPRDHLPARCIALFLEGCDTAEMAKALQISEHQCEQALHVALDRRRGINSISAGVEA